VLNIPLSLSRNDAAPINRPPIALSLSRRERGLVRPPPRWLPSIVQSLRPSIACAPVSRVSPLISEERRAGSPRHPRGKSERFPRDKKASSRSKSRSLRSLASAKRIPPLPPRSS